MLCGRHKEEAWRNTGVCALCPLSAQSTSALVPNLSTLPLMDRPCSLLGRPLGPTPCHLPREGSLPAMHCWFPRGHMCIHSVLGTPVCWHLGTGLASPSLYHVGAGSKPTLNNMTPLAARPKGWCGRGSRKERDSLHHSLRSLRKSLEAGALLSPSWRDKSPTGFFQFL